MWDAIVDIAAPSSAQSQIDLVGGQEAIANRPGTAAVAAVSGLAVVASGNSVTAFDSATGSVAWTWESEAGPRAWRAVASGGANVFAVAEDGFVSIAVSTGKGKFAAWPSGFEPSAAFTVLLRKMVLGRDAQSAVDLETGRLVRAQTAGSVPSSHEAVPVGASGDHSSPIAVAVDEQGRYQAFKFAAGGGDNKYTLQPVSGWAEALSLGGKPPARVVCSYAKDKVVCVGSSKDGSSAVGVEASAAGAVSSFAATARPAAAHGAMVSLSADASGDRGVRAVLVTADGSAAQVASQAGPWEREEGLSAVVQVQFFDLPFDVSSGATASASASPEDAAGLEPPSVADNVAALAASLANVGRFLLSGGGLLGAEDDTMVKAEDRPTVLTRDAFGHRKLAVVVTAFGKAYAIQTVNAKVAWGRMLDLGDRPTSVRLLVTRRTPQHNECVALSASRLAAFDPITGAHLHSSAIKGGAVLHAATLPEPAADRRLPVLVVTSGGGASGPLVSVASSDGSAAGLQAAKAALRAQAPKAGFWLLDRAQGLVTGYRVPATAAAEGAPAVVAWRVRFEGRVASVAQADPESLGPEVSPVRVTGDMNVLAKYRNPALVALLTTVAAASELHVLLLDTATGSVLRRIVHRHAGAPVASVMADNGLVVSYFNTKSARQEITSLEMYASLPAGYHPLTSSAAAIPDLDEISRQPEEYLDIKQQTYTYDNTIRTMGVTVTGRGITLKHIVLSLSGGGIMGLDQRFVDPRRPVAQATNADREEGLVPLRPLHPPDPALHALLQPDRGLRPVHPQRQHHPREHQRRALRGARPLPRPRGPVKDL